MVAKKKKYTIIKGCAFSANGGVVNDSIGRVFYAVKANPKILLAASTQSSQLNTPATSKTINNNPLKINTMDCFYKYASTVSIYSQEVKVGNNQTTRKLTGPTLKLTKIKLADNILTLDIRNNDPWVLPHADVPPFDLFTSIAITNDQVSTVLSKITSLDKSAMSIKISNETTITAIGYRNYYKAQVTIAGSQSSSSGKPTSQLINTGIYIYSIDKCNWISTEYASDAFILIQGTQWDNQIIPNPIGTNPFGSNWNSLLSNLQSIISDANNLPAANDNHGNRLFNQAIRDYLYAGDLNNVTFQMAFRLPFFIESTKDVPYTTLPNGRFNNPYYTKFDSWFGYANSLRASASLPLLTESGKLTTEYSSAYFDYNLNYQNLLTVSASITKVMVDDQIPAYIAKNFDFENGNGYLSIANVPYPSGSVVKQGAARNLDNLVSVGMITADQKTGIVNGTLKYVVIPDDTYGTEQITDCFVTSQKNSKTNQIEYFVKHFFWNHQPGTTPNNSALTFGFGFDVGGKSAAQLIDYIGIPMPASGTTEYDAIMGAVMHKKLDSLRNYFTYYDSVWKTKKMQVPFERAVVKTAPIMKSPGYLGAGVVAAGKGFIKNGQKLPSLLLRIFEPSFGYFYNEGNIHQFLNEFEKIYFLSLVWNKGTGSLTPYTKNAKLIHLSEIAKRAIHSFNVHDTRYHQYSLSLSQISHAQKISDILNSPAVNNYFLNI